MGQASAKFFLAKMNDSIEALYKERNAISTVQLKEIEIGTQTQPYQEGGKNCPLYIPSKVLLKARSK